MTNCHLFILSGSINAGKTTFCNRLIHQARHKGFDVAGILSPPLVCHRKKVAIEVENIRSGERKTLAQLQPNGANGPQTDHWYFHADALQWGNDVLTQSVPCDLLIVDELGPLELLRNEGWMAGVDAIASGKYRLGVVVIRPALLQTAMQHWEEARVIFLTQWFRKLQSWWWRDKLLSYLENKRD